MLWLYLHLPHFSLDLFHRGKEKTQPGPLALVDAAGKSLLQVNAAAASQGIQAGMSATVAGCLVPDLKILTRRPEMEIAGLEDLAQWAQAFSARISLQPPQGLLLEIGSMLTLFGGLSGFWHRVADELDALGFTANLAVAWTPLAAQVLAEAGGGPCNANRACLQKALGALPVEQAGLPDEVAEKLVGMGFRQLEQLLALPVAELGRRFGQEVIAQLGKLTGRLPDPRRFYVPPPVFRREISFIEGIEQTGGLQFPLQRLTGELSQFLRQRHLATDTLFIRLKHYDQAPSSMTVGSAGLEYQADEFLKLCRLYLAQLRLPAPVTGLSLQVDHLQPLKIASEPLFNDRQERVQQQLLSRLQARLGRDAVQGLAVVAEHRPEKAWCYRQPEVTETACQKLAAGEAPPRPLWLLDQPEELTTGRPQLVSGPERIVSGWWDDDPVCRDYYLARHPRGGLCWAFRTQDGRWFIHGWFA